MKDISRKISIQRLAYHMSTFDASIRHHFKVTDPTARHFICPLCLEQEIIFKDNDFLISESFTLEHLPPESIGGFFKTITCTNCNSRQGTDEKVWQDFAKLNAISYGFPVKPLNIRAHTETSKLHKAWMGVYPNGNRYFDFPTEAKFNNPDLKEMLTRYKDGIEDIKLVITIEQEKLNRALLKSAYLICFLTWGYDFTNSENGERMRNVLKGKDDYPINLPITVNFLKEQIQPQVSIIHEPKELETYCVHIVPNVIDI